LDEKGIAFIEEKVKQWNKQPHNQLPLYKEHDLSSAGTSYIDKMIAKMNIE
jgi:hypothetical protein